MHENAYRKSSEKKKARVSARWPFLFHAVKKIRNRVTLMRAACLGPPLLFFAAPRYDVRPCGLGNPPHRVATSHIIARKNPPAVPWQCGSFRVRKKGGINEVSCVPLPIIAKKNPARAGL